MYEDMQLEVAWNTVKHKDAEIAELKDRVKELEAGTVYIVNEYRGSKIAGVFTREAEAKAYQSALEKCFVDDFETARCLVDDPSQRNPVVGYTATMVEGKSARIACRNIVGSQRDYAAYSGENIPLLQAWATRATKDEALSAVAKLIAEKRATRGNS